MNVDLNDPLQALLAELRYYATVLPRYRAVMPHATAKLGLVEAQDAVAQFGGHVERSELWLFSTEHQLLGPWQKIPNPKGTT